MRPGNFWQYLLICWLALWAAYAKGLPIGQQVTSTFQELIDGINRALQKDAENRQVLERNAEVNRRIATLTPREREVMDMVVDGRANKVIAIDLGLSERTVEIHRANVMDKMKAQSVAHLVKMHLSSDREN